MAERLSVAQDVEGSIPSSRPNTLQNLFCLFCLFVRSKRYLEQRPFVSDLAAGAPAMVESAQTAGKGWLTPYLPIRMGGHWQTLAGNYWRRAPFALAAQAEAVVVDSTNGSRVLCHCHWQPEPVRSERLTIVLVHGLEGSSESGYMRGITARAWAAGCNVIRMNMRNCGGTESWTPTLYHSGLSADVGVVLEHFAEKYGLQRMAMAGYSMGGNLVLKLVGELGQAAPAWLVAAVGVCAATDLAASADALHEPRNRVYEWHFLRNLMRRFRRKSELYPKIYLPQDVGPVRTIREFDDKITARYSGFDGADDYYFRSSSARVVARIALPTLVLHAQDDPFIRMSRETREALANNPSVSLIETERGGHCAFLARAPGQAGTASGVAVAAAAGSGRQGAMAGRERHDRHWAEATLVRFLLEADRDSTIRSLAPADRLMHGG